MKILSVAQKMQDISKSVIYTYRGSIDNYSDLPTKDLTLGDVYNIANEDEENNIKAGDNVAWTGSKWDNLSGIANMEKIPSYEKIDEIIATHNTSTEAHDDIRKLIPTKFAGSDVKGGDATAAKVVRTSVITDLNDVENAIVFLSSSSANGAANLPAGIETPWFGSHMGSDSGKIQILYAKNGMFTRYCDTGGTWSNWINPINETGQSGIAQTAGGLDTLTRNTAYNVGDVVYCSSKLPSWARLICTVAGTTAPTDITVTSANEGDVISDGAVTWVISDVKHAFYLEEETTEAE